MHTVTLVVAYWFLAAANLQATVAGVTFAGSPATSITVSGCTITGANTGIAIGGVPGTDNSVARAFGPYPTAAMCQAAEHTADRTDSRFWTPELKAKWAAYDKDMTQYNKDNARINNLLDRLAKANPKKGRYLYDGREFIVNIPCQGCQPEARATDRSKWGYPTVPSTPEGKASLYQVINTCQPVKGWYALTK